MQISKLLFQKNKSCTNGKNLWDLKDLNDVNDLKDFNDVNDLKDLNDIND